MKKDALGVILLVVIFLSFLFSCKKESASNIGPEPSGLDFGTSSPEILPLRPCDFTKPPKILDSSCIDFQPYYMLGDTSLGNCKALKSVYTKGSIEWKGNSEFLMLSPTKSLLNLFNWSNPDLSNQQQWWGAKREQISITFDPNKPGYQKIYDYEGDPNNDTLSRASYLLSDYDIFIASWKIRPAKENFINIVKLDTVHHIIEGDFQLYFAIQDQNPYGSVLYSNRVQFTCGRFRAKPAK